MLDKVALEPDNEGFVYVPHNDNAGDISSTVQSIWDEGYSVRLGPGTHEISDHGLITRDMYQKIVGAGHGSVPSHTGDFRENRAVTRILVRRKYASSSSLPLITLVHPHCAVRSLDILFEQDRNIPIPTRKDAIQYPPAIKLLSIGPWIEDVVIRGAWNGVRGPDVVTTENHCGRGHFERVYIGALNEAWRINGAAGTVQFSDCQVWPFGFETGGWIEEWKRGEVVAWHLGGIDNLQMANVIAWASRIKFANEPFLKNPNIKRGPIGNAANVTLDGSYSCLEMTGGRMSVANVYKTTGANDDFAIDASERSELSVTGLNILNTKSGTPYVRARNNAHVQVPNPIVRTNGVNDVAFTVFQAEDRASLTVTGADYDPGERGARGVFLRQKGDSRVTAMGNRSAPVAANDHDARFIVIEKNREHVIMGNHSGGMGNSLPLWKSRGVYANNR